ncbi:DUF4349 domain-containing protein [Microbacterium sp. NC79]|uniref:DUF4349 domain-containing protein n=1 Tax=Microbacterium sp. NC79 TaxID=2851009 RepID=UPI001C2C29C8|nr:DUF4349 domain-containing protein [Microbacterium sp. NC79]MBV0894632.1 DUF4349 domain-containing protein [Microbacterium sp. NC79]
MNKEATRTPIVLPELSNDAIARMEDGVFQRISEERTASVARGKRKRSRTILWSAAAATVVVAGAALVPSLLNVGGTSTSDSAVSGVPDMAGGAADRDSAMPEAATAEMGDGSAAYATDTGIGKTASTAIEPQVITSASISLTVADIEKAVADVTTVTTALSGYVASQNVGSNGYGYEFDPAKASAPTTPTYGWITVRIPEASVNDALTQLEAIGTVTATTIDRYDVTQQSVDLKARVSSLEASVARLEELMKQSGSVGDLITAEAALSQRQAELESLQQQLDSLTDQVAMSTISVDLRAESAPVDADPNGFGDGLLAGWNGLVAAFNGIIIALGFALPWLAVLGVIGLVIWLVVRARRSSRSKARASQTPVGADNE